MIFVLILFTGGNFKVVEGIFLGGFVCFRRSGLYNGRADPNPVAKPTGLGSSRCEGGGAFDGKMVGTGEGTFAMDRPAPPFGPETRSPLLSIVTSVKSSERALGFPGSGLGL